MFAKAVLLIVALGALSALAQQAPDWHGTFTANNKYGGVMYACPKGNTLYGVYSDAGFFIGAITGRTVEGNWYEGGRGDRNDYQGSFRIEMSEDNQEFDGFWYRVTEDGKERRWHETRLGAPHPSNPTDIDCLVPGRENLLGSFYRQPEHGAASGSYHLCKDEWSQVYGSFTEPEGYLEGWSVDSATGFHGYRYDASGRSGAYILRAVDQNTVRGFYWRGRVARQNIETVVAENLTRTSFTASLVDCEASGPGFLQRLRGPDGDSDSASALTISAVAVLAAALVALF